MELDIYWGNRRWLRNDEGIIVEDIPLEPGDEQWTDYESLPVGTTC